MKGMWSDRRFFFKTGFQEGVLCHTVATCLCVAHLLVRWKFSKVVDADPDDRFGDFESVMHLYAWQCVSRLACLIGHMRLHRVLQASQHPRSFRAPSVQR